MADVAAKVKDIVVDKLGAGADRVTMETSFVNDLQADSLDLVEFVMELEEQFDINIPEEDAEKIKTVGDAVKYIEGATKK